MGRASLEAKCFVYRDLGEREGTDTIEVSWVESDEKIGSEKKGRLGAVERKRGKDERDEWEIVGEWIQVVIEG